MCGIVGIIGQQQAAPQILEALKRLEYRGYDSAGIATLVDGEIVRRRAEGKLVNLDAKLKAEPLPGVIGIGHTRWATHGAPTENNAHPHATARVAVVHNGIIENFRDLRSRLTTDGAVFRTETDSEVIAHLATHYLDKGLDPRAAVAATLGDLRGAFALAFMFRGEEDLLIGARRGCPLAVGFGRGATYLGSDAFALAPFTSQVAYLEEGDRVELTREGAVFHDAEGRTVTRPIITTDASAAMVDKGNYRHFMAKEIHEQPEVIGHTIGEYLDPMTEQLATPELTFDFADVSRVTIIGCGSAYYAGLVAKYWFERYAHISADVEFASEFRYREPVIDKKGLAVFVSQSGETADTLAALHYCKAQGLRTLAIVNVPESSMARHADTVWRTYAGPEIGVASTKALTCQLAVLAVLAVTAGKARGVLAAGEEQRLVHTLLELPRLVSDALAADDDIRKVAALISKASDVLYLGRGALYPVALEGALKLKEISYIHAEGYAAGELKHGPIALIDEKMPIITIAPVDGLFEKTVSNMHEVAARGGRVVLISDRDGLARAGDDLTGQILVPAADPLIAPIICTIPVQLLAYHTAVLKGTDVDQPRNLAKSVTVE
ncbi:MAG: glutamine--fructose-6-phosphate transaminase (isomerizing) [Parvibaculaceae bacterium]|nr:glutamine--fructose-6-phosphate transaminase (isomerizing) [Parvibaculaceae bacterium]